MENRNVSVSATLGPALIVFATAAIAAALRMPAGGLQNPHDPGPRFIPLILAGGLLAWGLFESARYASWRWRRSAAAPVARSLRHASRAFIATHRPAIVLVACLVAYLAVMPWIGFALATVALIGGMLWSTGTRLWSAVWISIALVVAVELLFRHLFKVQLPSGELGLPF